MAGLLLTGAGERNKKGQSNFLIVDQRKFIYIYIYIFPIHRKNIYGLDTTPKEMMDALDIFLIREDIGIILINQHVQIHI